MNEYQAPQMTAALSSLNADLRDVGRSKDCLTGRTVAGMLRLLSKGRRNLSIATEPPQSGPEHSGFFSVSSPFKTFVEVPLKCHITPSLNTHIDVISRM
jgi:hypothetical protein